MHLNYVVDKQFGLNLISLVHLNTGHLLQTYVIMKQLKAQYTNLAPFAL